MAQCLRVSLTPSAPGPEDVYYPNLDWPTRIIVYAVRWELDELR